MVTTICGELSELGYKIVNDKLLNDRISDRIKKEIAKNPDFGKAILSATPEQFDNVFGEVLEKLCLTNN